MSTQLGWKQRGVLKTLADPQFKYYRKGCAWRWNTHLQTVKLLDSLVKRGLVEITLETVDPLIYAPYEAVTYRLTPAGAAEAELDVWVKR